jgi:hypothetical protein
MSSQRLPLFTGIEFSVKYKNGKDGKRKFYKLTNEMEIHKGFQFETGLNIDSNPLGLYEDEYTGLYFCEDNQIYRWIHNPSGLMYHVREVFIPDDAVVCVLLDCFKTNKFYLDEPIPIWTNHYFCTEIVKKYNTAIKWVGPEILTADFVREIFGKDIPASMRRKFPGEFPEEVSEAEPETTSNSTDSAFLSAFKNKLKMITPMERISIN